MTDTPYCPQCGQPRPSPLGLRRILEDAFDAIIDLNAGFLYTFKRLTTAPGRAIREYCAGRRKPYTNPLKYAFISTTVLGLVTYLLSRNTGGPSPPSSDLIQVTQEIAGPLAYGILVAGLGVAVLQRAIFVRESTTIAEWYVFQLYVWGHLTWIMVALVTASAFMSITVLENVLRLLEIVYVVWALAGMGIGGRVRAVVAGITLWLTLKIVLLLTLVSALQALRWTGWDIWT